MKYKSIYTIALVASVTSHAQNVRPDAGSLIQQVPRPEPLRPSPPSAAQTQAAPPTSAQGPQVLVRQFKLQGNQLLSQEQLATTLAPYLNQMLDLGQLERVAQAVARRYREDGWVVSASLPAQDITQGEVIIRIDEARLGALRMNAAPGLRGPQQHAQRYFDALLTAGQPLNADAVDRAQMLGNELLGLDVATSFRKGQSPGSTDIEVGLSDKPALSTDLLADNSGARATGRERLNAQLEWRNPLAGGDSWNLALMHTQGSDNVRLGMGLPVGDSGWRVGGSAAHYQFRLIAPEFAALHATGTVQSLGLEAAYPLLRQRERSLSFLLNADHKTLDNRSGSSITSHYRTQATSMALQGLQYDGWLTGGKTTGQLGLTAGQINLNGSPTQAQDATGARTEGRFTKLRANLSRQQNLGTRWTLQLSHTEQWANKNLDSSEKFFIGGPDSVRAFPVSEAGGARGRLSSLELGWRVDDAFSLSGFYDQGQVRVNVDNAYAGAPSPNSIRLQGAGLSAQWRSWQGWSLKATWARRLQDNPHPTTSGTDQDGSLVRDRIWVSAAYSF